jgi:hypothetical protein
VEQTQAWQPRRSAKKREKGERPRRETRTRS